MNADAIEDVRGVDAGTGTRAGVHEDSRSSNIFQFRQRLAERDMDRLQNIGRDDICFFRFVGGNPGETDGLVERLLRLKETRALLIGIFRFPFRFEGKKRLQTSIVQYHRMKELCDAVIYFDSDGMMEILKPGTSIQEAHHIFEWLEEAPIRDIRSMVEISGEMNIDMRDIQTFVRGEKGPLFVRTFEGEEFDEPLKYLVSTPYLPEDYTEGKQMIVNIGCAKDVDLDAFRQMNLRLNDLFHKTDLVKLGMYYMDEPGERFRVTLLVNGIEDPFERPEEMKCMFASGMWWKCRWRRLAAAMIPAVRERLGQRALKKEREV